MISIRIFVASFFLPKNNSTTRTFIGLLVPRPLETLETLDVWTSNFAVKPSWYQGPWPNRAARHEESHPLSQTATSFKWSWLESIHKETNLDKLNSINSTLIYKETTLPWNPWFLVATFKEGIASGTFATSLPNFQTLKASVSPSCHSSVDTWTFRVRLGSPLLQGFRQSPKRFLYIYDISYVLPVYIKI